MLYQNKLIPTLFEEKMNEDNLRVLTLKRIKKNQLYLNFSCTVVF